MNASLLKIITDTQAEYRADATAGQATFRSSSSLSAGLRSDISIREHRAIVDEPTALGGDDAGPNPIELILAALGSCQEITYKAFATAMDIELTRVSVELEGDIDLRGFFAVDDSIRAGYQAIRGTVHIESSAAPEQIEQLRQVVNTHCPVLDMLTTPVPVVLELDHIGAAAVADQRRV